MPIGRVLLIGLGLALLLGSGCGDEALDDDPPRQVYDADGARLLPSPDLRDPPNLIVLVIDALRYDAISPDGRPLPPARQRMPFFQRLADEGVQLTQVAASAPWTLPSMMSLLTGLRPSKHGQNRVMDRWHLPAAVTTLPEVLRSGYGYETAAFVNGDWFRASEESLLQGFEHRELRFSLQDLEGTVGRWRRGRDAARPFFLLLHTFDVHDPYGEMNHPWPPVPPGRIPLDPALLRADVDPADVFRACYLSAEVTKNLYDAMGRGLPEMLYRYRYRGYAQSPRPDIAAELRAAYWGGARWADGLLESAYEKLERWGLLENTLLVVTADHGEAFGEHGNLSHCIAHYDEVIRVPMVLKGPAPFRGGHRVRASVGLMDLIPTFLDWIGAGPLPGLDARSAMPLFRGDAVDWCRPVVSEERLTRASTGYDENAIRVSVRTDGWKYIVTFDLQTGQAHEEAYDLRSDPGEREDLGEGTGVLPTGTSFDTCFCSTIEEIRDQVWRDLDPNPVVTSPYGTGALGARSPRPEPCR